jgi:hypothetical protein
MADSDRYPAVLAGDADRERSVELLTSVRGPGGTLYVRS